MIITKLSLLRKLCAYFLLFTIFSTGCASDHPLTSYQDEQLGFSIEHPSSWELQKNERVFGEVILEKDSSLLNNGSARVALSFGPLFIKDGLFSEDTMLEGMSGNIENLVAKYGIESAEVLTYPEIVSTPFGYMVVSTISVDTLALPNESRKNRTGFTDSDHKQIIAKYYFVDPQNERFASASVYYGLNEKVNDEADQIINSLRFIEN